VPEERVVRHHGLERVLEVVATADAARHRPFLRWLTGQGAVLGTDTLRGPMPILFLSCSERQRERWRAHLSFCRGCRNHA
jgi:hypothetical protein